MLEFALAGVSNPLDVPGYQRFLFARARDPAKFGMLRLPDDGTIGNSDMMAVWALDARERIGPRAPLHWDGLNKSIREVVVSSALGDGAAAREFDCASMDRIGTDANRLAMWSDASRDAYTGCREGYDGGLRAFQNVEGYVAETLDGLWLRGPYLHNGSVPTLADLLAYLLTR